MTYNRTINLKWEYPSFPPLTISREVLFSLMEYKGALYFLNGSDEILDVVSSDSYGLIEDST